MQTGMEGGRKRARTDEQKSLRRQSILDAAESLFREGGFEAFSMAKLAKLTGVVKGTLYLYFETREEVFLVLYIKIRYIRFGKISMRMERGPFRSRSSLTGSFGCGILTLRLSN